MFNGRMMSVSTVDSANEVYTKSLKMKCAINYGHITQNLAFKIIDLSTIQQEKFQYDHI